MTFHVYESSTTTRRSLGDFATFEVAEGYIQSMAPVHYQRDADHPGCADAFLRDGRIVSIEARA